MECGTVLSDLSALTPPFLVCAAFLTALVAFLRHEMRDGKKRVDDEDGELADPTASDQIADRESGSSA
jgi:hypothetical protein